MIVRIRKEQDELLIVRGGNQERDATSCSVRAGISSVPAFECVAYSILFELQRWTWQMSSRNRDQPAAIDVFVAETSSQIYRFNNGRGSVWLEHVVGSCGSLWFSVE